MKLRFTENKGYLVDPVHGDHVPVAFVLRPHCSSFSFAELHRRYKVLTKASIAQSPSNIGDVLRRIERGKIVNEEELLLHVDDSNIRSMLISQLKSEPGRTQLSYISILGYFGGEGAVRVLLDRLAAQPSLSETLSQNSVLDMLETATAVLRLCPENQEAAEILLELLDYEEGYVSSRALESLVSLVSSGCRTGAYQRLRGRLRKFAETQDASQFAQVFSVLLEEDPVSTLRHCVHLLRVSEHDEKLLLRNMMRPPSSGFTRRMVDAALRQWFSEESDLRLLLQCAWPLSLASRSEESIIRDGLADISPGTRNYARERLSELDPSRAIALLEEALDTEPDKHLQTAFAAVLVALGELKTPT